MKNLISIFVSMIISLSSLLASGSGAITNTIESYYAAYQDQDWETLVTLMHPDFLSEMKSSLVVKWIPSGDLTDEDAADIRKVFGVNDLNEILDMGAEEFYVKLLSKGSETPRMKDIKKTVKAEVRSIDIEEKEGAFLARADVDYKVGERKFTGSTLFTMLYYEGKPLVRSLEKIKETFQPIK